MVAHTLKYSTWEAEAGVLSEFEASLVYVEFQDSWGYIEKPCGSRGGGGLKAG